MLSSSCRNTPGRRRASFLPFESLCKNTSKRARNTRAEESQNKVGPATPQISSVTQREKRIHCLLWRSIQNCVSARARTCPKDISGGSSRGTRGPPNLQPRRGLIAGAAAVRGGCHRYNNSAGERLQLKLSPGCLCVCARVRTCVCVCKSRGRVAMAL